MFTTKFFFINHIFDKTVIGFYLYNYLICIKKSLLFGIASTKIHTGRVNENLRFWPAISFSKSKSILKMLTIYIARVRITKNIYQRLS
jgi:type IV secretory pathway VirB3-like protein